MARITLHLVTAVEWFSIISAPMEVGKDAPCLVRNIGSVPWYALFGEVGIFGTRPSEAVDKCE